MTVSVQKDKYNIAHKVRFGNTVLEHTAPKALDIFVDDERYYAYALRGHSVILSAVMDDAPSV